MIKFVVTLVTGVFSAFPLPAQDPPNVFLAELNQRLSIPNVFAIQKQTSRIPPTEQVLFESDHPTHAATFTQFAVEYENIPNGSRTSVRQSALPSNTYVFPACRNCIPPVGQVNQWRPRTTPQLFFRK